MHFHSCNQVLASSFDFLQNTTEGRDCAYPYCHIQHFSTDLSDLQEQRLKLSTYFISRNDMPIAQVKRGIQAVLLNDMEMLKDAISDIANVYTVSRGKLGGTWQFWMGAFHLQVKAFLIPIFRKYMPKPLYQFLKMTCSFVLFTSIANIDTFFHTKVVKIQAVKSWKSILS